FSGAAATSLYTLPLHDALPMSAHADPSDTSRGDLSPSRGQGTRTPRCPRRHKVSTSKCVLTCGFALGDERSPSEHENPYTPSGGRSEEHTSELQSRENLVCRLLLEKKTNKE